MSDSNIENYEASQRQRQPLKQVRVLSNANLRDSNRVEENSVRRDKNKKQVRYLLFIFSKNARKFRLG